MMVEQVLAHKTTFHEAKSAMKPRAYPSTKSKFRQDARSRKNWNEAFPTINQKTHQFHVIESNKEATLKIREFYLLHREPRKQELRVTFFENRFRKKFQNNFFLSGKSQSAKNRKLASCRINN